MEGRYVESFALSLRSWGIWRGLRPLIGSWRYSSSLLCYVEQKHPEGKIMSLATRTRERAVELLTFHEKCSMRGCSLCFYVEYHDP